jgi:hypothetical protein
LQKRIRSFFSKKRRLMTSIIITYTEEEEEEAFVPRVGGTKIKKRKKKRVEHPEPSKTNAFIATPVYTNYTLIKSIKRERRGEEIRRDVQCTYIGFPKKRRRGGKKGGKRGKEGGREERRNKR